MRFATWSRGFSVIMIPLLLSAVSWADTLSSCPVGQALCASACVDVSTDPSNCGGCGLACPARYACSAGSCGGEGGQVAIPNQGQPGTVPLTVGTWSQRTAMYGGRIDGIVELPGNSDDLAVASPGGGIWFTNNGGSSWSQPYVSYGIDSYLGDFTVVHLEWDRLNPGTVLFAQTSSDIYSASGCSPSNWPGCGSVWTNLTGRGSFPAPLMPLEHIRDPRPFTQMVLKGTTTRVVLTAFPCEGLWYSINGSSFTQVWPFSGGSGNPDNCVQTIAADDPTGYVYFGTMDEASGSTAHLFRSQSPWTTSGPPSPLTWVSVNSGLPSDVEVCSLVDTADYSTGTVYPNNLVTALWDPSTIYENIGSRIFETSNGTSWSIAPTPPSSSGSSYDPRALDFPGLNQIFLGTQFAFQTANFYTDPISWSTIGTIYDNPAAPFDDVRSLAWDQTADNDYLWYTTDGSLGGAYGNITRWPWTLGSNPTTSLGIHIPVSGSAGLPIWQAYVAAEIPGANNAPGERMYVGLQDSGAACSDNLGSSWAVQFSGSPGSPPTPTGVGIAGGDVFSIAFAPSDPNIGYAVGDSAYAYTTNAKSATSCGGVSWTYCGAGFPSAEDTIPLVRMRSIMAIRPNVPSEVAFVEWNEKKIAISTNSCSTSNLSAALPHVPLSVAIDDSGDIFVGTYQGGAYYSTNGGSSWNPFGLNSSPPTAVLAIASSPAGITYGTNGSCFFLATTGGLYRQCDGSANPWNLIDGGNGYTVSDVAVDPACSEHVYDAYGYVGVLGQHRGGINFSSNVGGNWSSVTAGLTLHQSPIAAINVDPYQCGASCEGLWAASYGLGSWFYDSGSTTCP